MFRAGQVHYAESIHEIWNTHEEEIHLAIQKFKVKYWGRVSNAQWKANDLSANDEGAIIAKYVLSNGSNLFLYRLSDCSYLIVGLETDMEKTIKELHAIRNRRGRQLEELLWSAC